MRFTTPRLGSRLTRVAATLGLVAGVLVLGAPAASATAVDSISAGSAHGCVLTAGGGVKCWGYNNTGMVGDGTYKNRAKPVNVKGLGSGVADVQAVWDHSCALTNSGQVLCWGHNGDGELGNGNLMKTNEPGGVTGMHSGQQQVSLGFDSGCALSDTGGVKCWGYNGNGQLGDGTRTTRKVPVQTFGLTSGVVAISAGWDHTCALMNTGGVKCWGENAHGEVGDGTRTDRLKPVDVSGLTSGVAAVSAGYDHTCALMNSGSVKCWGNNATGELGNNTTTSSKVPVNVSGLSGVASLSAGFNHTCVVTNGGGAKCWGNNRSGELGDGTTKMRKVPKNVYRSTSGIKQISAGGYKNGGVTCLTTTAGVARCFGSNHKVTGLEPIDSRGFQLGDGTKIDRYIPITVRGLNGTNPKRYRPDALISKRASGGFVGGNIYNKTGQNQTKAKSISPGGSVKFTMHFENDGPNTDSFFLQGSGSGDGFAVKYATGGKSIKGPVTSGTYWFTLAPGDTRTVVMTIKAGAGLPNGAQRGVKVLVRSAGDSSKVDVVRAIVTV